jgi:hypothetical protein
MEKIDWELIEEYSKCDCPSFYFLEKETTKYMQEVGKAVIHIKKMLL